MIEINNNDKQILRDLAFQVNKIASSPIMSERKRLWTLHNDLRGERPMIFISPEGASYEVIPLENLQCENIKAREIEWNLRFKINHFINMKDDMVIDNRYKVAKKITIGSWGIDGRVKSSDDQRGAWGFDPLINDFDDLDKLKSPTVEYDEKASIEEFNFTNDIFGDILDVQLTGITMLSYHLMNHYTKLRGLSQVMVDMIDNPAMVHKAMRILTQGYKHITRQYLQYELLSLNNDDSFHYTGGNGYTNQLPQNDFDGKIRLKDLWASSETQEFTSVSPKMHREFVFGYEKELLEPVGLAGYGCCGNLTQKIDMIFEIKNIRRISISSWSDIDKCVQQIGNKAILSWKPRPSYLVGEFNDKLIRDYLKHTVDIADKRNLELVLRDTHTCENRPERFYRWSEIASEIVGS